MDTLWWVAWPLLCAAGTGLVTWFVMRSRTQVLLSRQREELASARAELAVRKEALVESLKHVEDAARRQALDDFLADIRIEERSYVREHKAFFLTRKSLIRQERMFFRNIPLSNWVEQEMPFEEGADVEKLAQTMSVFAGALLEENERPPLRHSPLRRLPR